MRRTGCGSSPRCRACSPCRRRGWTTQSPEAISAKRRPSGSTWNAIARPGRTSSSRTSSSVPLPAKGQDRADAKEGDDRGDEGHRVAQVWPPPEQNVPGSRGAGYEHGEIDPDVCGRELLHPRLPTRPFRGCPKAGSRQPSSRNRASPRCPDRTRCRRARGIHIGTSMAGGASRMSLAAPFAGCSTKSTSNAFQT